MRISKEVLKKVVVEETNNGSIELINVQTGDVEETIETGKRVTIKYDGHCITLYLQAGGKFDYDGNYIPQSTQVITQISINFDKLNVYSLAALFTVYKDVIEKGKHAFDHLNLKNIQRQQYERDEIHQQILKEEKKYEKKLLMDELKRLAKENVDKRKPPVTAALPKLSAPTFETLSEE